MRLIATFLIALLTIFVAPVSLATGRSAAVIYLSPASGPVGADVSVSGTGFLPTDTTCSFSSDSSVVTSAACVVSAGVLTGGFIVGNVLPGAYVIEATGDQGDLAQALLNVNGAPQLGLSPATGQPGTQIAIQASGFMPTDTTCSISSPSSTNVILTSSAACVLQSGSGAPMGGFMIGNASPGQYVIEVTGNQGDSAQAILDVR